MPADDALPLRLPFCMPVSDARAALESSGEVIALVTTRGVDIGVVTAGDLAPCRSIGAGVVGDVMEREIVNIAPTTDLHQTLRTYREAAWSSAIRRRPAAWPARAPAQEVPTRQEPGAHEEPDRSRDLVALRLTG